MSDAPPQMRVGVLMLAGERDDTLKLGELGRLDEQRKGWWPVAGGMQHAGDDPDVLAQRVGVIRLARLNPGEHARDDLGRTLTPQRLPVVAVGGARVDEDERAARRGREATQKLLCGGV